MALLITLAIFTPMAIFAADYIDSIENWGHIHQLKSSKIDEALLDA
jgi:hypothetical protein